MALRKTKRLLTEPMKSFIVIYHNSIENTIKFNLESHMIKSNPLILIILIGSIVYLSCSQDASQIEWKQVNSGTDAHLYGVHFVDAKLGWAVGTDGVVLSSKDGGKTWNGSDTKSITKDTFFTQVSFTTPNNGWLVGIGKVYYTGSGGNSWNVQHQLRVAGAKSPGILDLHFVNKTEGWAVGGIDPKGISTILHTQNGGGKWEKVMNPAEKHLWGVYFVNSDHGWVVGEEGVILHTKDGGKQWELQNSNAEQPLFAIHFADLMYGWVVGSNGLILHTADGGQTWERQQNPIKLSLRDIAFKNEKEGWAVGEEGSILHTTDGGTTWNQYASPTINNLQDIFLFKNSSWIVGEKGTILRSH